MKVEREYHADGEYDHDGHVEDHVPLIPGGRVIYIKKVKSCSAADSPKYVTSACWQT